MQQPPAVFECTCGATHNSHDRQIPVGWSTSHGQAWCNACTLAGIPAREAATAPRRQRRAA